MNDKVDLKRRNSRLDLAQHESDQDRWLNDRRTLAEKVQEVLDEAGAEIQRVVRKAFESES
jgi:hypothetical protein